MQRKQGHAATGTTHHTQRSPPDMGGGLGSSGGGGVGGGRRRRDGLWSQHQRPASTTTTTSASSLLTLTHSNGRYDDMNMNTGGSGRSYGSGSGGSSGRGHVSGGFRDGHTRGSLAMEETFKSSALRGVKLSMGTMTLGSTTEDWGK